MIKKTLGISLLLLTMVFAFGACDGEAQAQAQEITESALQVQDDINSYRFETTSTMEMAGETEGEAIEGSLIITQNGEFDPANLKMHYIQTMISTMTGSYDVNTTMDTYVIEDEGYVASDNEFGEFSWSSGEIPEGFWEDMNQVDFELAMLEASTKAKVIGSETVNGVDCYVLEISPAEEHLWELFMQQMGMSGGTADDADDDLLKELVKHCSAKQWIAKDSYFLMKAEITMSVELTPEMTGSSDVEGEVKIDTKLTLMAYDYNQPLSIELPPGAEEAVEYSE
ncbi:MAG: hypothetical protein PVJ61_03920 [Dehalococcoidia bacterium]